MKAGGYAEDVEGVVMVVVVVVVDVLMLGDRLGSGDAEEATGQRRHSGETVWVEGLVFAN